MKSVSSRAVAALASAAMFALPTLSLAQPAAAPAPAAPATPAPAAAATPAPAAAATPAPAAHSVKLLEGTELTIRFNDKLSSATNTEGDQFSISLDDDVKLADGTVLKAGYGGKGEVTDAKKKGFMGQAGEMNVRLNYIRVGDTRVRLRASKGGEGKGSMGATVALTLLFGPLGLLKRGHDIEIKSGQTITAYVDQDAEIVVPVAPPPQRD